MGDLEPGQQFGPYRLQRRLGAGAFGEVWLALSSGELDFTKQVALKVFREYGAREEIHQTLLNEARLAGHLRHPRVVDVYDAGLEGAHAWLAMEYLPGRTLADVVNRLTRWGMRIPRSVTLDIGIALAEALHYAHTACDHEGAPLGIVHRDLKPANVMVDPSFGLKVLDFGIARAATNVAETLSHVIKGTPAYMAPEVWRLEPALPRADLFAVGVMLYELATSQRLSGGRGLPATRKRVLEGTASADAQDVASWFPELAPIVEALLQRDPEQRTQTSRELLRALRRLSRAMPAPATFAEFLVLAEVLEGGAEAADDATVRSRASRLLASGDDDWLALLEGVPRPEDSVGADLVNEATTPGEGRSPRVPTLVATEQDTVRRGGGATPAGGSLGGVAERAPGSAVVLPVVLVLVVLTLVGIGLLASRSPQRETAKATPTPSAAPTGSVTGEEGPEVDSGPTVSQERLELAEVTVDPGPAVEATTPSPRGSATPSVTPGDPEPTPEVLPQPTEEPALPPQVACLELESRPIGATVRVDGELLPGVRAATVTPPVHRVAAGAHRVEMLRGGEVGAGVEVDVEAGQRYRVTCRMEEGRCGVLGPMGGCD